MPELAEVQTVAAALHRELAGRRALEARELRAGWAGGRLGLLEGRELERSSRWGKRIRLEFSGGPVAVASLGMTGAFELALEPSSRHAHAVIRFEGALPLWHVDPRRFGSLAVFEDGAQAQAALGALIGRDAADPSLDGPGMAAALGFPGSRAKLKAAMIDQARLAGLGNWLCDEICHAGKVSPARRVCDVLPPEWEALSAARAQVIAAALDAGGFTFSDYRAPDGSAGTMASRIRCYGRAGLPCLACGAELAAGRVAGRATVSCPACQP